MLSVAENLIWHLKNKSSDGKMRCLVDYVSMGCWPDFAIDLYNLRLGLSTDGFNPFSNLSSKYSC